MEAKKFLNYTNEDFKWKWDGVEYSFPAGQSTYLEDFKADHFAKHLVDRELQKLNLPVDRVLERNELTQKCFPLPEPVTVAEALNINETAKEIKKVEEFPDLVNSDMPKVKGKKTK